MTKYYQLKLPHTISAVTPAVFPLPLAVNDKELDLKITFDVVALLLALLVSLIWITIVAVVTLLDVVGFAIVVGLN